MTEIGTVLGGRYRLVELLGQGGMATIYRARDNQLERDVAVKVLRPEYGADPDFNDRFRHEAQSAASLNHPSVVGVYDYGTDPVGPFIVMELVEGEDLSSIIRRSGALPPRAAARVVAQAARAVGAAHDRGFVHRDIKPGNMLVDREGRVKVADFGIARALSESGLTLPGTTLGSVHYFSPEQARGELASPASDIYSLGIVLYELLTGRRPWTGDSAAAIATARLTSAVPSPSAVRGGIPPPLEAITRRALAPSPESRFPSAGEMADALEAYLGEERPTDGVRGKAAAAGAGGLVGAAGAAGLAAAGGAVTHAGSGDAATIAGAGAAGAAGAAGLGAGAAGVAAGAAGAGLAASAGPGVALAGGAGPAGSPTGAAGVARPNPDARSDYPGDAYAGGAASAPVPPGSRRVADSRASRTERAEEYEDEEPRRMSPWVWLSALLALGVLALAAFLLLRLLGGPDESPAPQVTVPNFVGMTVPEARQAALPFGLEVEPVAFVQSSADVGTVTAHEPPEGTLVDRGSTVELTVATAPNLVPVPDLRLRTEAEAVGLIQDASLRVGGRSEEFDSIVPAGSIVSQDPAPLLPVPPGTAVSYVVSKGPEPTPTPEPTPPPPPPPTPTPVPPPTPTPTPSPIEVGEYRCTVLILARAAIENDGFEVGSVSGPNDDAAYVVWQEPEPGVERPPGTEIDLTTVDQPAPSCPMEP